jgi:N-methylhydantoinase A
MAAATRAHAAEKGIDLRRYSMIAFGGAGPVHAYAVARKLGLRRVVCPFGAGVASAVGCLVAPPAIDLVTAFSGPLKGLDWARMRDAYDAMRARGEAALKDLIGTRAELRLRGSLDMRCQGQGYAITVPMPDGAALEEGLFQPLMDQFGALYSQVYGHRPPDVSLEVVNLRARIGQDREAIDFKSNPGISGSGGGSAFKGRRPLCFGMTDGFVDGAVYDRYALAVGETGEGPAAIEERETTTIIGPDARFRVDDGFNLIIEINR